MKSFIFSILILGMVTSCNTNQKTREANLDGIWILKTLNGKTLPNFEKEIQPKLELDLSEKHFSGTNGCNNIFGNIKKVNDSELEFGEIATTQMACPDMTFSFKFNELLKEVQSYELSDENNTLILYDGNNQKLMEYVLQVK